MANDDHVTRLTNSVTDWNEWREQYPGEFPDLVGADLREADLREANLSHADLQKADLTDAELQKADLSGADLSEANLTQAKLEGANLAHADLRQANLFCAVLPDAIFEDACLEDTNLFGANLRKANLRAANLKSANLQTAVLEMAVLEGTNFQDANLFGANLRDAKLREATLENADLRSATDLTLDKTAIRGTRFDASARDPWSILRRNYSGPRMVFNLLFLVAFFAPYLAKVAFWAWVNQVQTYAEAVVSGRTSAVGVDSLLIRNLSRCLAEQCDPMPAWQLIIGVDRGWLFFVLAIALITYNTLRAGITWRVASLREEEERTGYSPAWTGAKWWQNYRLLFWAHQYFVRWVFWIAIVALIYNACDWLTRTVWIPS